MHSIRTAQDKRGDTLTPNAKALALQQEVPNFGIESVFKDDMPSKFTDWTKVVTDPGLFCKDKLF